MFDLSSAQNSIEKVDFREKILTVQDGLQEMIKDGFAEDTLPDCKVTHHFAPLDEKYGCCTYARQMFIPKGTLIIGKIQGFSDESDRVAYDLILQAETGFMSINGTQESGPLKMPVALIDVLAAHHLKEGLLLALMDRTKNGTAKTVEVSLYDAAVCSLMNQASNYLMAGKIPERMGSLHPNIAPYGELFETKDGQLITFAIGSNLHFSKLCRFLELDLVLNDIRFMDNQQRVIHRRELEKLLDEKVSQRTSEQISTAMRAEKVPYGIVKKIDEVLSSAASKKMIKTENINAKETKRMSQIAFKWK